MPGQATVKAAEAASADAPAPAAPDALARRVTARGLARQLMRILPPAALIVWVVVARPWVTLGPMLGQLPAAPIVLALAVIFLVMLPVRTLRWRTALPDPPGFLAMYAAQLEGQTANIVIGLGMADVVRAARLRRERGTFAEDLGTVAADRASEYLVLFLLLGAAACAGTVRTAWLLLPIAYLAAICFLVTRTEVVAGWLERWPRARRAVVSMRAGFGARPLTIMSLLAVANWGAEALMLDVVLAAMGLPAGLALSAMVVVSINLAIAIPGPPANLGTFEAGVVLALASAGVPADKALSFALFYHALFAVPVALVGGSIWSVRNVRGR